MGGHRSRGGHVSVGVWVCTCEGRCAGVWGGGSQPPRWWDTVSHRDGNAERDREEEMQRLRGTE